MLDNLISTLTQTVESGGSHTPPEARLFMLALAKLINAKDILETGYDAGYTTLALAMSNASIIGVDNSAEYSSVKKHAAELLSGYPNVKLINCDAIAFLTEAKDESFDLIFIDDNHGIEHVRYEMNQVKRILRPGGIAIFHDTIYHHIGDEFKTLFSDWYIMPYLPCYSPYAQAHSGFEITNFGLGIVQKPFQIEYRT